MKPNTHCSTCDMPIHRKPSKLFTHNYCNQKCRNHHTIVWIGYIYANHTTMRSGEMAAHIGIPMATFRTWVFLYNQWGLSIRLPKGPARKVRTPTSDKGNRTKVVPVYPSNHGKPPKKDPATFESKVVAFDPTKYRMVKVDGRTWKQVPIDNKQKTA